MKLYMEGLALLVYIHSLLSAASRLDFQRSREKSSEISLGHPEKHVANKLYGIGRLLTNDLHVSSNENINTCRSTGCVLRRGQHLVCLVINTTA